MINKLIIVGNGFDLAHGLKTSYLDFVKWYFYQSCKASMLSPYKDSLISVQNTNDISDFVLFDKINDLRSYINFIFDHNHINVLFSSRSKVFSFTNPFDLKIRSELVANLLNDYTDFLWVDVENVFYKILKQILKSSLNLKEKKERLDVLNKDLESLISHLQTYLSEHLEDCKTDDEILDHLHGPIDITSIIDNKKIIKDLEENSSNTSDHNLKEVYATTTHVLNFNYTNTLLKYQGHKGKFFKENHIHGTLDNSKNPIVFGFGDELDEGYLEMEREEAKGYFKFIKSFWYFRTRNYLELVRFLQAGSYQVYIWGHSCGLSDRTLLNMIFEHDNCTSIRVFYRVRSDGSDNFGDITEEISRHFKNKQKLRNRVLPKDQFSILSRK